jgi:predicted metal-binding protein
LTTDVARPSDPTIVLVCTSCRRAGDAEDGPRAGRRLHDALLAASEGRDDVRIVGVECLSVCKRPVTIGFSDPAKWSYVYAEFDEAAVGEILATAALYGEAADGLIPWRSRPIAFRQGVVARIPPIAPREVTA